MTPDKNLYFIAIIPPPPIYDEAKAWKEYFAENHHSKAALKSPPHITLHMPFKMKEEKEELLCKVVKKVAQHCQAFEVALNGFGHFGQRVIYINVEENDHMYNLFKSVMKTMKINFNIYNADYKKRGFHPHLTLAFRDLKKESFKVAWPEFKEKPFEYKFKAEDLTLLKHNGKAWEICNRFNFN